MKLTAAFGPAVVSVLMEQVLVTKRVVDGLNAWTGQGLQLDSLALRRA